MRIVTLAFTLSLAATALAVPIAVKQTQGVTRGFLLMRSSEGRIIARGELNQTAHGDRVKSHLVYRFRDGSLDEETTVYTQRGTFRLVSDHHVQKGPYFPKPSDYLIDVPAGTVTSRSPGKDGHEKVEVEHMSMPDDLANGLIAAILLNSSAADAGFKVGMIAPSGKGRPIKLAIGPAGEGSVQVVGTLRKANIFRIKVELGGVAGVVAPIIGKQPADVMVWILPGEAPGFVRQVGQVYNEGPIVSVELSGASFPRPRPAKP